MTGQIQYFGLGVAAGTGMSYQGIITGGRHTIPNAILEKRGIGSHKGFKYANGLLTPNGTVDFDVQDNLILTKGIRTAGVLPEFGVECGDTVWAATHKYCKCNSLALRCDAGDELTGTMGWLSKQAAETSGAQTQTAAADIPLIWNSFALTGVVGLEPTSFEIIVTNGLLQQPVLETAVAATKRFPKYLLDTGQEMIGLNFTSLTQNTAVDITADALAEVATITIVFVGTKTLTLTLTECQFTEKGNDFTPDAMASNGLNLLCGEIAMTYL